MGDKLRLQQILTILLDNAFASCKHGSLIKILANYERTHINVSIKTAARKEIGELANKRLQQGFDICGKIIKRNNGTLVIRSRSNGKCTVKFSMQMFEVGSNFPKQLPSYLGN